MMTRFTTRDALIEGLAAFGIRCGDTLLVHTRMSALGYVPGASQTVVEALLAAVGPAGTIMMPAYSGDHSDPAEWRHPEPPADAIDRIRASIPPYDPHLTPTRRMGALPEYFRSYPGCRRSLHPQSSFCAIGAKAERLVGTHPIEDRFGPGSPLGALVDVQGKSLLLGAPLNTNSLLYLALYPAATSEIVWKSAPVRKNGAIEWIRYKDIAISDAWFADCTEALLAGSVAQCGEVCGAKCHLFPAPETIETTKAWLAAR